MTNISLGVPGVASCEDLVPGGLRELAYKRQSCANVIGKAIEGPAEATLRIVEVAHVAPSPHARPSCEHVPDPLGYLLDLRNANVTDHFFVSWVSLSFLGFFGFA